jgi:DNA replication protein DnaC
MEKLHDIELKEDEYIKDNLIYCKLCNTPRSLYIKNKLRRCICDCLTEKRDEEMKLAKAKQKELELEKLKIESLIGERYKGVKFDNCTVGVNNTFDVAFKRCKKYCDISDIVLRDGMGIYLFGDTGVGKTHITACMANELLDKYYSVLFTNFFEISKAIKSTFGKSNETENDYINRLANIDFLFIDDLGTERVQNGESDLWLQEKIFDVINRRYNNKRPTIFTSNHSLNELVTDRGFMRKTVDRIAEMSTAIIKIEGESYRLKNRNKIVPF